MQKAINKSKYKFVGFVFLKECNHLHLNICANQGPIWKLEHKTQKKLKEIRTNTKRYH